MTDEIIRKVFSYLTEAEVYFNIRCVCRQLQILAEAYVQLGGIFLLAAGDDREWCARKLPSEILFVLKQNNKVTTILSKLAATFPIFSDRYAAQWSPVPFGATCKEKLMVGYGNDIFEYSVKENKWIPFPSSKTNKNRFRIQGCLIGHSKLLTCGHKNYNWGEDENYCYTTELFQINLANGTNNNTANPSSISTASSWTDCATKLPVVAYQHTMTSVGPTTVMLTGGIVVNFETNRVFQGTLSTNEKDVTWKELEPMIKTRFSHASFKLQDNVYVIGGQNYHDRTLSSCERYNLKENKWYMSSHRLPYPLYRASVITDYNETFAIISGGCEQYGINQKPFNKVIIFTEEDGFKIFPKFSMKQRRQKHVSLRIK